jgi:predicted dehydrogenase
MGALSPVPVALIGCGAVARLFYAPALRELSRRGELTVAAIFDPAEPARVSLGAELPGARVTEHFAEVLAGARLAIVASPPRWHREQAEAAFSAGLDVLCEKPLAGSFAEAEAMCAAARRAGRRLAVGHYKRFFPVHQWIKAAASGATLLGALQRVEISEGGKFTWPAASASFFHRSETPGGVLLDLGVHWLDLLRWWLGEPTNFSYEDDALGGLEANCLLHADWPGGAHARMRLSRDGATENACRFSFERGEVRLRINDANHLELTADGLPGAMVTELRDGGTNAQSFILQLRQVVTAVRDGQELAVPGEEGAAALGWIEGCYARRRPMPLPWLGAEEEAGRGTA